ncbi:hypothetical protein KC357_g289 [Hortaea werneckii]|nr:hypothetical protein KC357_g289 [Hortaea werneckii]
MPAISSLLKELAEALSRLSSDCSGSGVGGARLPTSMSVGEEANVGPGSCNGLSEVGVGTLRGVVDWDSPLRLVLLAVLLLSNIILRLIRPLFSLFGGSSDSVAFLRSSRSLQAMIAQAGHARSAVPCPGWSESAKAKPAAASPTFPARGTRDVGSSQGAAKTGGWD